VKTRWKDFCELSELLNDSELRFWDGSIGTAAVTTGTTPGCAGTAAITIASDNALIAFVSFGSGVLLDEFLALHHVVIGVNDVMSGVIHFVWLK